jgi:3-oxosteroid 1-dehydrogenase
MGLPHTLVVNRAGKRFANEAFYRSIYFAVDAFDGQTQSHPNFPAWIILDAQARAKYPFGSLMPGQDFPEGFGITAGSLAEIAARTGINAAGLAATIAHFNTHAANGQDPDFARGTLPWGAWMAGDRFHKPNPNLGPLTQAPYYAVELSRLASSGIAGAGVVIDHHARAVGWDGAPIPGLYLAGNSAARLDNGAVMQSGMSNARGLTQGWLAGRHAAGHPSTLLETALQA